MHNVFAGIFLLFLFMIWNKTDIINTFIKFACLLLSAWCLFEAVKYLGWI